MNNTFALNALEVFIGSDPDRYMPLNSGVLNLAASLWASTRQKGLPTSDFHALDIDVILSAQVLSARMDFATMVVATSNAKHLSLFVPAAEWSSI